ncbi:MAG: hypothetical protein ABTD50_18095 [Polyangiaceae bacterium]|jgi:alpha-tubulin suppressor-like RCC1 family protein
MKFHFEQAASLLAIAIGAIVLASSLPARGAPPGGVPCSARANAVLANATRIFGNAGSGVDSYQSSLGPYGGGNVGDTGNVQAGTTIAFNGGIIAGAEIQNAPAGLVVFPVPSGATNLPLGSTAPGNVNINSEAQSLTLVPGTYVAANLNVNFPGAINVSPPGPVVIWVTGSLDLGGSENPNGVPENLQFLVTSSTPVDINGNGALFGFVYAPLSTVNVNSSVFGSVVGSSVSLNSGGAVHFDQDSICPLSTPAVISRGFFTTCAVSQAGDAKCWGVGTSGELGNGLATNSLVPVGVSGLVHHAIDVSAPQNGTSCGVTANGGAVCWGRNDFGGLGNGTTIPSLTPVPVTGLSSGVTAVSVGGDSEGDQSFACAITAGGAAMCWGRNDIGNLGNGTTIDSSVPVQVTGLTSGVTSISAGEGFVCAVTAGGAVMCWGANMYGTLGNGAAATSSSVPVQVTGLTSGAVAVSAGTDAACAVTGSGGVVCWGQNEGGALGNGTTVSSSVPVQAAGLTSGVKSVSVGRGADTATSCALTTSGSVFCWGSGSYGALGAGASVLSSLVPIEVPGLAGATSLSVGWEGACVVLASGGAECWGLNSAGELGNGTTTNSFVPTAVLDFP